jgi:DNA-binding HxlR family transcriptional regulator
VKSYQQYCAVARALDVVGDRWVLLIVRELMAFGPSRFSDLQRGLPGIASNLLAERLRSMETADLIERHEAPAPIGSQVYQLTARGRELEDVLRALTRWGMATMPTGPTDHDAVQPQWTALLAGFTVSEQVPDDTELVLGIETSSESRAESVHVVLRPDGFEIARGLGEDPDVTLRGSARLVGGVLSGLLSPARASRMGLRVTGRRTVISELFSNRPRTGVDR